MQDPRNRIAMESSKKEFQCEVHQTRRAATWRGAERLRVAEGRATGSSAIVTMRLRVQRQQVRRHVTANDGALG